MYVREGGESESRSPRPAARCVVGRRRLLLAGIGLFTAASVLCGVAPTLWALVAARAAQGLGAAVMLALAMAFVGEAVPTARTGSALGLLGTMSAVGTALGPTLGGVLVAGFGWRAIFLVNAPLGILALLLAALSGLGLFVLAERRAASPLISMGLFGDPAPRADLATSALVMTVMMTTLVVGPFYLPRALGLEAALVGLVMSVGPLVAALTGVPAGRVVDRLGAERVSIAGLVGVAAGSASLSVMPAALGVGGYVVPMVAITAGYALFQVANNTAVMKNVRPGQRGVVSGLLNLSRNLGLVTGAAVMGAVFAVASGTVDVTTAPPDAVATGVRTTFGLAALLVVVALAVVVLGRAESPWHITTRGDVASPDALVPSSRGSTHS